LQKIDAVILQSFQHIKRVDSGNGELSAEDLRDAPHDVKQSVEMMPVASVFEQYRVQLNPQERELSQVTERH
jgi:hypothetical protein